jgi:hypothetical protein
MGNNLSKFNINAFLGCNSLTKFEISKNNPYYKVNGSCVIDIAAKSVVKGVDPSDIPTDGSVTSIGDSAFAGCSMEKVVIPDCITVIGMSAFSRSAVTELVLPESLTRIGAYAFASSHITELVLPESLTVIEVGAFQSCDYLVSVEFPKSKVELVAGVFSSCHQLKEVVLPEYLTVIPSYTFAFCRELEKVVLHSAITEIGAYAFEGCEKLKQLEGLHETALTKIGDGAFRECSALTEVIFPQTMQTIERSAFSHCVKLAHIYIPKQVSNIAYGAFENCPNLANVEIEEGNENYWGTGNSIIRTKMRRLVYAHASAVLPNDGSVQSFGEYSFYCTGLEEVVIPATIKRFRLFSFVDCEDLKMIIFLGTIEEWNSITKEGSCFGNSMTSNVIVQCSDGTIELYFDGK